MRPTPLYEREIVMHQQAIIFTKDNASLITDNLIDYTDPYVLLAEYDHLFTMNRNLILVRSVMADGQAVLSYVVATSMFNANAKPVAPLTDTHFTDVVQL
jgi:hypothetical protein